MGVTLDFEIYSPQADPARRALSYRTTRRSLRRRFLKSLALLGAGVVFSLAFVLVLDDAHRANQRLVILGVRTTGVVTALHRTRRGGWIHVSYTAEQRHLTAEIDLGAEMDRYAVGQKVDVYYDRDRPTRMTIAGVVNQSGRSTLLMVACALIGVASLPTGLVKLWVSLRSRRVLANSPWREVPATIAMDSRSRVVAEVDETPSPAVFRSPSIAIVLGTLGSKQGVWTTGHIWIAGPMGRRAVLALPGGGDVLPLRSARTTAQARRWTP
jgi:hypothetical protein